MPQSVRLWVVGSASHTVGTITSRVARHGHGHWFCHGVCHGLRPLMSRVTDSQVRSLQNDFLTPRPGHFDRALFSAASAAVFLLGAGVLASGLVRIIDLSRRFGIRSYYGDATRPALLEAAGADTATLFVAALDDGGMDSSYVDAARARAKELDAVMQSDRAADRHDASERGWTPPPKGDATP